MNCGFLDCGKGFLIAGAVMFGVGMVGFWGYTRWSNRQLPAKPPERQGELTPDAGEDGTAGYRFRPRRNKRRVR